ncbi:MAG: hypothetical protein HGB33_06925, partial [Syntrophaceae bacterium]|nr:hypothetical protein [Syntrophaceae bacterium]
MRLLLSAHPEGLVVAEIQREIGIPGPIYLNGTQQFLAAFSMDAPAEQRVVVSGHIVTPEGGFRVVNAYH